MRIWDLYRPLFFLTSVITIAQLCACAGGNVGSIPISQASVSILPASASMAAGAPQQFTASVPGNAGAAVIWQVNGVIGGSTSTGTISATGLYTAPNSAANVVVSMALQSNQASSAKANVSVLAPHRFGVRTTSTLAEFYDRSSGNTFVPRGNNYIRLAPETLPDGSVSIYHSTFDVGAYDASGADAALTNMRTSGYNTVRVWLNGCCHDNTLGNPGGGLSSAYLANLADFLRRAKSHSIFVILSTDWVPAFGGYTSNYASCTQFGGYNTLNLCAGGVQANVSFFHDLARGLVNQNAALDAIFAYELRNEYYYESNMLPLSLTSGTVTTADGQTYDMSSPISQQQMMDNGLIYFSNQVRAAILAVDPTALVTVGFFVPQGPNPTRVGDPRVISVYPAIASSAIDFVDVHGYPIVWNLTMAQLVQNYGFVGYQQQKPVMMGEFGAFTWAYPLASDAAAGLQSWQIQSCAYNFQGWMLWTWDTNEQPSRWNALSQGGVIDQALSPALRPDPCSP
jgi:hypothetical protein